jgi:hypothetical protein
MYSDFFVVGVRETRNESNRRKVVAKEEGHGDSSGARPEDEFECCRVMSCRVVSLRASVFRTSDSDLDVQ